VLSFQHLGQPTTGQTVGKDLDAGRAIEQETLGYASLPAVFVDFDLNLGGRRRLDGHKRLPSRPSRGRKARSIDITQPGQEAATWVSAV
jgi:hypothetical protein